MSTVYDTVRGIIQRWKAGQIRPQPDRTTDLAGMVVRRGCGDTLDWAGRRRRIASSDGTTQAATRKKYNSAGGTGGAGDEIFGTVEGVAHGVAVQMTVVADKFLNGYLDYPWRQWRGTVAETAGAIAAATFDPTVVDWRVVLGGPNATGVVDVTATFSGLAATPKIAIVIAGKYNAGTGTFTGVVIAPITGAVYVIQYEDDVAVFTDLVAGAATATQTVYTRYKESTGAIEITVNGGAVVSSSADPGLEGFVGLAWYNASAATCAAYNALTS